MTRFKKGDDLHQAFLLPPSVAEWLPEGHLAWFIEDAVDELVRVYEKFLLKV